MHLRTYIMLWMLVGGVYCCNLGLDVMEVDAAQYAAMSAEMADNHSFLQVFHRGADYLDKPPLLFWLSSASFQLFGVGNVPYKLPALLILLLGLWSLYKLTRLYHERDTALMATTILATTQAFFLMSNDVRTDGLLTGFVIFAVYACMAYLHHRKWQFLVLGGIGVGLAMLAKGPIGAAIPVIVIVADRVIKGKWRDVFRSGWLLTAVVALILLLPMCYGLYQQFDLHPEKTVYGLQGPSGLKFFFWTQSFGRITGDIYWDNNTPFYFFVTTFLWDFMPWVIVFVSGLVFTIGEIFRRKRAYPEFLSSVGAMIILILLSLSKYKLPHYIFPLLPFAAMLTARYLSNIKARPGRWLTIVQLVLVHLFFAIMAFAYLKAFSPGSWHLPFMSIAGYCLMWAGFFSTRSPAHRIVLISAVTAVTFNAFMALHMYPQLMQYQSGAQAGRVVRAEVESSGRPYYVFRYPTYTFDFYSRHYAQIVDLPDLDAIASGGWIFMNEEEFAEVEQHAPGEYKIIRSFDQYHISMLKLGFVLKESRTEYLKTRYLIEKR